MAKEDENTEINANEDSQGATQFTELIKLPDSLNSIYNGYVVEFKENYVKTRFSPIHDMIFDEENLIYTGFIYAAANYAALLAVNSEFAVTIGSRISFLSPVELGDEIEFEARAYFNESKKREVRINGVIGGIKVFEGAFQLIILEDHIFRLQKKEAERQQKESAAEKARAAKAAAEQPKK